MSYILTGTKHVVLIIFFILHSKETLYLTFRYKIYYYSINNMFAESLSQRMTFIN